MHDLSAKLDELIDGRSHRGRPAFQVRRNHGGWELGKDVSHNRPAQLWRRHDGRGILFVPYSAPHSNGMLTTGPNPDITAKFFDIEYGEVQWDN
jgi:hypothetical protein